MPALLIESYGQLEEILRKTEFSSPHQWLISYLECYDTTGWEGCEKWENRSMILTDEELRRDVYLRNMQFIWGAFSAIPAEYSKETVLSYGLPDLENPRYMSNHIVPQHPLATLEISAWDGWYTYICSDDAGRLEPFWHLPYVVSDAEESNRRMNEILCRIQTMLRANIPDVTDKQANEIQWECWHALFKDKNEVVSDARLTEQIQKSFDEVSAESYTWFRHTMWDPFLQP